MKYKYPVFADMTHPVADKFAEGINENLQGMGVNQKISIGFDGSEIGAITSNTEFTESQILEMLGILRHNLIGKELAGFKIKNVCLGGAQLIVEE